VASSNRGKVAEFAALLAPLDCDVFVASRRELAEAGLRGIGEPVEDGGTFFENAYIKARYWADILGMPCLADDSGIMVRALGGEPGVRSARWGGLGPSPAGEEQCRYLLKRMEGAGDRSAAVGTSLVIARPFRREALHYRGEIAGEITREMRGGNGFGYDFVFAGPGGRTLAELTPEEKGAVSHRGRAVRALREDWPRVRAFLAGGGAPGA
jgi:XTP/dITP diphosphohydrolase